MCGISAAYNVENSPMRILDILLAQQSRGRDATGIAYIDPCNNLKVIKKAISPEDFEKKFSRILEKIPSTISIGHNRMASVNVQEKTKDKEAHPFLSEDKSFALVHNGTLSNYSLMFTLLDILGHKRSSGVDSEVFVHILEELLIRTKTRDEAIKKLASVSDGNILILFNDGTLYGIPEHSFYIAISGRELYIASEEDSFINLLSKDKNFKLLKPSLDSIVKIYQADNKVKIKLWGDWKESVLSEGTWIYNRTTSCDFCQSTGVPCEDYKINNNSYDRCLECYRKNITTPKVQRYYYRQTTLESTGTSTSPLVPLKKSKGLFVCAYCGQTLPLDEGVFCSKCKRFSCLSCWDKHDCSSPSKVDPETLAQSIIYGGD